MKEMKEETAAEADAEEAENGAADAAEDTAEAGLFGGMELHKNTCSISYAGKDVKLSLKEYQIMELLIANPRQILPKERIIEKIWGYESDVEYNNIEVYISFLRKKINSVSAPVQIKTARGIGYSLE